MLGKCFLVLAALCALSGEAVEGKRMVLRPIPAATVREILKAVGREDAVPEGRVISHGLAALNGFALGLKKGIIGVALADSWAALSLADSSANSTAASKPSISYNSTSDQLCFTSRSATSDIVASGDAEERAESVTGYAGTAGTTPTGTSTAATTPTTATNTGTGTGTNTATNTATTTEATGGAVNCIVLQKG